MSENKFRLSKLFLRSSGVFLLASVVGLVPNVLLKLQNLISPISCLLMGAVAVVASLLTGERRRGRIDWPLLSGGVALLVGFATFYYFYSSSALRLRSDGPWFAVGSATDKQSRLPECACPEKEERLNGRVIGCPKGKALVDCDCDPGTCPERVTNEVCVEEFLGTNPARIVDCWGEPRMSQVRRAFTLSSFAMMAGAGLLVGVIPHRVRPGKLPPIKIKVFISYRRSDSATAAGRIYEHLARRIQRPDLFKDVDSIHPGEDFEQAIQHHIEASDVLLAVIGPTWSSVTDAAGRRRLEDEGDFVRREIETALQYGVRLIPLLQGQTPMPSAEELPPSLRPLLSCNSLWIRDDPDFGRDMELLLESLGKLAREQ